jgi:peptidoglycan/xylan/chitin deacetylase (PgdA/CDA1 family)
LGRRDPRVGALVAVVLVVAIAIAGFRIVHHLLQPVVPAVVLRDANAHRLLSPGVGARIDRFLHDRPPPESERVRYPKLVALSFDDGPYPVETPLLLDVLSDLHVPATFFLIGHDALEYPQLADRIERAGDEVANHTQTHPADFEALSPAQVTTELREGAATLDSLTHDPAIRTMMRPPHGRFTERTVKAAQAAGYAVILWNDDPGDWREVGPQAIVDHMVKNASAPEIVLLHSGRLATIEALPEIVSRFRAAGFSFVTVGKLLAAVPVREVLHPAKLRV